MFTFCFIFLLIASLVTLASSVKEIVQRRDLTTIRSRTSLYTTLFVTATLSVVLAMASNFPWRYEILGFMAVSLTIDYWYFWQVVDANQSDEDAPRRRWWPIIDNSAWIVAIFVLYFM